jgi:molecular chaperone DnaK (HSP70)
MRIGIDFGTCNSSAALMMASSFLLVKDGVSLSYSLPSSVFAQDSGELVVGQLADDKSFKDPARYRQYIKRELHEGNGLIVMGKYTYQVKDLIRALLEKLKSDADTLLKARELAPLTGAVLTVPVEYQDYKREILQSALAAAGFRSEEICFLEEPIAAALYYAHQRTVPEGESLLVYDLGGGTFDTVLLQRKGASYDLYPIQGNRCVLPNGLNRGGIDFDRLIYADLLSRSPALTDLLNSRRRDSAALLARNKVLDECRKLKMRLSYAEEGEIALWADADTLITYQLTRTEFIRMITPYVRETIECCHRMLRDASLSWDKVDRILLVGGSCRIPFIHETIQQQLQRPIFIVEDPELAVCQGAALYAAQLDAQPTSPAPSTNGTSTVSKEPKSRVRRERDMAVLDDPWNMWN